MSREILFKAKNVDTGKWVEGDLVRSYLKIGNACITDFAKGIVYGVDNDTICQYTGLTDKNGNKIWENDVVKKHFYTDYDAYANSEEYTGKVEYLDFAWCITFEENKHKCVYPIFMAVEFKDAEYYEVIGNIFDNPELLKGSEENE
jgi:uncharacterized phage protein (TIGR01671 family)